MAVLRQQRRQALRTVLVVVDHEDATGCDGRRRACRRRRRCEIAFFPHDGQAHNKLAAPVPAFAANRDGAAVHFREPLRKRQTDAQPAFREIARRVDLREQIEHPGQHVGRDADARNSSLRRSASDNSAAKCRNCSSASFLSLMSSTTEIKLIGAPAASRSSDTVRFTHTTSPPSRRDRFSIA